MKKSTDAPQTEDLTKLVNDFRDEIAFLRTIPMFDALGDVELARLCQVTARRQYPAGSVLLAEGDFNDALYLVREGTVGLFHPAAAPKPFIELGRGRFFGQVSMFDPAPSSATVRSCTDVEVMCLRARPLSDLFIQHPGTATRLLMAIIQDLAKRHRAMLQRVKDQPFVERHHL
ncbi:MAG: cyclic nucleotide-binding domain-containing protein [Verrucomicrobia bacterium]|nr:cyclic nucleotide-binding domain-containing protein [Verrucomicrobiota bacterium]